MHAYRRLAHYAGPPLALAACIASLETPAFSYDAAVAIAALKEANFSLTSVDNKPIEATFCWGDFSQESLAHLASLDDLQHLTIRSGYLDDSAGDPIAAAMSLVRLRLTGRLTDKSIGQFARLTQLRTLDLRRTEISPGGLSSLGELKNLEELVLAGTQADSKHVSLFPRLRVLDVSSDQSRSPTADFSAIAGLKELQILDLSGNKTTTDHGLSQLVALKHLRALLVAETAVTDACVDSILKLPSLQSLDVHGTRLTKDGVVRLEQGLPECLIRR
jgi:Leucine-rich repeat (LRR) protein